MSLAETLCNDDMSNLANEEYQCFVARSFFRSFRAQKWSEKSKMQFSLEKQCTNK